MTCGLNITRRRFLRASAVAAAFGATVGFYTWRWEPHWLEFVERRLPVTNLPERLVGSRVAQLSDLHVGPRVNDAFLIHAFDRVKELAPGIIVYTGDFTSYEADIYDHIRRVFAHLPVGSRATFGILGNHDYGPNWAHPEVAARIAGLASAVGVRILRNEVQEVDGLQIVGLDDLWAHRFELKRALAALDPLRPSIALSHNPDTADDPAWGELRRMDSGWTYSRRAVQASIPPSSAPSSPKPALHLRRICAVRWTPDVH